MATFGPGQFKIEILNDENGDLILQVNGKPYVMRLEGNNLAERQENFMQRIQSGEEILANGHGETWRVQSDPSAGFHGNAPKQLAITKV
ncbi:hypothetical protein [Planctomicrobium piriforme]|uniref:Uncharacterized protein n=1 Tax=Planctomicrobium piriforme TaxID=1576369 RepID=A0A1I3PZ06_9PLAN|nr:hypothetical protein [Planctomicrobium piriforme]SFJ27104.1 hypothetical protein SAMN05421753_11794 [Planctomicrobium piriforme]